jgi:hypothetical protein
VTNKKRDQGDDAVRSVVVRSVVVRSVVVRSVVVKNKKNKEEYRNNNRNSI